MEMSWQLNLKKGVLEGQPHGDSPLVSTAAEPCLRSWLQNTVDIDVDAYNRDVDAHNRLVAKRKRVVNSKKFAFTRYEQLIKEDESLVNQYNALLH